MKVALITGASGGIGSAICKRLVQDGYFVAGTYNNGEQNILKLKNEIDGLGYGGYFFPFKVDLSDDNQVLSLYEDVKKSLGKIDLLVLNAGIDLYKLCQDTEISEYDKLFSINVKSAFILSKKCIPDMLNKQSGNIIFVSSVWGISGSSMESVYSATKSAVIGLSKSLSKELAVSGIRVNCICPGVIDTPMNNCFSKAEMQEIINNIPLKRLGTGNDIAEICSFLASDKASYITGQTITVDGGFLE